MNAEQVADNPYALFGQSVAEAQPSERAAFIRRTYTHLAAAVYAFAALEWLYFSTPIAGEIVRLVQSVPNNLGMLVMLGLFIGVSWIANGWAHSNTSPSLQYAGLMGYVVAESLFFVPLLAFAQKQSVSLQGLGGGEISVIAAAGVATLVVFGLMTAIAWFSGRDFSFLGAGLGVAGIAAFGLIAASFFLPLHLGVWFTVGMIVFASLYILYDTSNVMHHYRPNQHVAASLALFASVALLFWYLLQLFMSLSSRD